VEPERRVEFNTVLVYPWYTGIQFSKQYSKEEIINRIEREE
jgi:hypothetical protein